MALVVNTNIAALTAKSNITRSEADLSTAMERLSSGKRINSAADDAAGLAMATRMDSQIRGFNQAIRNVNDGISMVQAVDGALGEINDALQRMRELAVQSVNGSNTSLDRLALQNEFASLAEQINLTAASTRFNGMSLLNGAFVGREIQAGASVGESIGVGFENARADALGMYYAQTGLGSNSTAATTLDAMFFDNTNAVIIEKGALTGSYDNGVVEAKISLAVKGTRPVDLTGTVGENGSMLYVDAKEEASTTAAKINASGTDIRAYAETTVQVQLTAAESANIVTATDSTADVAAVTVTLGSGQRAGAYTSFTIGSGALEDEAGFAIALAAEVNASSGVHGITAAVDAEDGKTVLLTQAEGRDLKAFFDFKDSTDAAIEVRQKEVDGDKTAFDADTIQAASTTDFSITVAGQVTMYSGTEFTLKAISGTANFDTEVVNKHNLGGADLTSAAGARASIALIDASIEGIANQRANSGALQNRLSLAAQGLTIASENQSAAYSRIVDADFASESSSLAKNQILQQVSTAMLAQANAMPQVALSLIQ